MQSYLKIIIWPIVIFILSCGQKPAKEEVPLEQIPLNQIEIIRIDQELQQLRNATDQEALQLHLAWKEAYGPFYRDFIQGILKIGSIEEDPAVAKALLAWVNERLNLQIADEVQQAFPDLSEQEIELTNVFKRVNHYLPNAYIPQHFYAYFSGFAVQIPVGENYMGMGLDLFLGAEHPYYEGLQHAFPTYISRRFRPDLIVHRLIETYVYEDLLLEEKLDATFLDQLLRHGKAMYLLDLLLPNLPQHEKIGYTETQLAWSTHHEEKIWEWMIQESFLYEKDYALIKRYFGEAPFTADLGKNNESSPKLGVFIGWQMVKKYMKEFPDTRIDELIAIEDAQEFLLLSKYKGR
jgi:hypothetical protein